jgi:plastocyanin
MLRISYLASGLTLAAMVVATTAAAGEITIGQKDKTFVMNGAKVETVTVKAGDTINFKNEDPWFHNIFSLSDLKTFDLGSYPQGQSKPVTFDKAGTAEVECAIHPTMMLKVEVK